MRNYSVRLEKSLEGRKSITLLNEKCLRCGMLSPVTHTIIGAKFSDDDHYQCLGSVEYECLDGYPQYHIIPLQPKSNE